MSNPNSSNHLFIPVIPFEQTSYNEWGFLHPGEESIRKKLNPDTETVNQFARKLGLLYVSETAPDGNVCMMNNPAVRPEFRQTFSTNDLHNYMYAVVHHPVYCGENAVFTKNGLLKVPLTRIPETFWQLVQLGKQLREIQLQEPSEVEECTARFPKEGSNTVTREITSKSIDWETGATGKTTGKVWINDRQYFENIPREAWDFSIGPIRPAQKWLKSSHQCTLRLKDIGHYRKIISGLTKIHLLMQKLEKINLTE